MSYYPKQKNELARIGADAFACLDGFSSGRNKSKPSSSSSAPISHTSTELYHYHYQYQSNPNYMVRQQVYVAPVSSTTETVVDCYEAAKRYGGTVIVDYPKKKPPARRGFFYR